MVCIEEYDALMLFFECEKLKDKKMQMMVQGYLWSYGNSWSLPNWSSNAQYNTNDLSTKQAKHQSMLPLTLHINPQNVHILGLGRE